MKVKSFFQLFDATYERMKSGDLLTPSGNIYRDISLCNYRFLRVNLERYGSPGDTLDAEWCEGFRKWMLSRGKAKNTISTKMGCLKSMLTKLNDSGERVYDGSDIINSAETTTHVYVTRAEIIRLMELDLRHVPGYERIRDVFVLHCYVGLRFTDLIKLLQHPQRYLRQEAGSTFFELLTNKTGEVVTIPVAAMAQRVMEKRGYDFGGRFSYSFYNRALKRLGQIAGFNDEIVCTRTNGGRRVSRIMKKYELLSSHTARRSFATNAFLAGVPVIGIMQITGHKSQANFMRYIRCSSMESAISIAGHEFFSLTPR